MNDRTLGGLIAAIAFLLLIPTAQAGEWFDDEFRVYAGITHDYRLARAPECHDSRWVGEFGLEYDLYEHGDHKIVAAYRHNSCLDELHDRDVQDGIGARWVYTFD